MSPAYDQSFLRDKSSSRVFVKARRKIAVELSAGLVERTKGSYDCTYAIYARMLASTLARDAFHVGKFRDGRLSGAQ